MPCMLNACICADGMLRRRPSTHERRARRRPGRRAPAPEPSTPAERQLPIQIMDRSPRRTWGVWPRSVE